jgi:hypothetical protein
LEGIAVKHVLAGGFPLPVPPAEAFRLFTPRGEQEWVPGWRPIFPAPTDDDTAPGTVFLTDHTTWVVVDCQPGRRIRYARLAPGATAGTVTVTVDDAAGGSDVRVVYELTALTDAAAAGLAAFAAGYPEYLRSWHDAITLNLG